MYISLTKGQLLLCFWSFSCVCTFPKGSAHNDPAPFPAPPPPIAPHTERLLQKKLAFEDPVYINGKRSLFLVSIQLQPRTWPVLAGYFLLLPEVSGDHSASLGKIKRQIKELQP